MILDNDIPSTAPANRVLYSGRFEQGTGKHRWERCHAWSDFLAINTQLAGEGLQLCAIETHQDYLGVQTFTGAWIASTVSGSNFRTTTWEDFQTEFDANAKSGLALVDLNFATIDDQLWFTGVWLGSQSGQVLVHDLAYDDFNRQIQGQNAAGLQLVKTRVRLGSDGVFLYTGLFQPGPVDGNGWLAIPGWQQFCAYLQTDPDFNNLNGVQVLNYGPQGAQWIVATWVPSTTPHQYVFALDQEAFAQQCENLGSQGMQLKSVDAALIPIDWKSALREILGHRTAGYTWGLANNGKVIDVGARGRAVRPASGSTGTPMTVDTPITLGSISKLIEAVAMLYVIQTGKYGVTLDTCFFDLIVDHYGISASDLTDPRVRDIKIRHLLTHSAGLNNPDPYPPDNTTEALWAMIKTYISQSLNDQLLGPAGHLGVVYCYCNAGFQTIRGIVQALTGADTYQDWVTTNILSVLGISPDTTYIPEPTRTYPIRYYQRNLELAPNNGVIPVEASWNSTPRDMLTLLASLRGVGPTILDANSLSLMFDHPTTLPFFYNETTGLRDASQPQQICFGFDAASKPAPAYVAKNGSYTDYSEAAVVRFDSPPLDIIVQLNTETWCEPNSSEADRWSLAPETAIINTFMKLAGDPSATASTLRRGAAPASPAVSVPGRRSRVDLPTRS